MMFRKLSRALAAALIVGGAYAASPVYAAETAAPAAEQSAEEQAPFDVQVVEQHVMATITRFEKDDITGLQAEATADLRPHLTAEQVTGAKAEFAPKWGPRGAVGKPLMTAGKEGDKWYVICELAVGYKATAVVYRLTYDENMKLAGFFVR
ncbi:DUF3887 domain-containing protein [Selenomonas dianae]|uniref:DUF3887 domain-containing protein n=1 Tax=Selenomonas dianae TaxID=135079 RepID=A0ABN0T675_9FIRM|nr:DUF3887 domain-containing protein [Selenomonas dianae]WLD82556.1 DUF3887 domain-containing protein [Selenomonas dianae]